MSDVLSEASRLLRADPSLVSDFLKTLPECKHEETKILWEEDSMRWDIGETRWCVSCGAYKEWHGSERDAKWVLPSRESKT